jgi:TFIIF-interacting CTD phosphatase-like protein
MFSRVSSQDLPSLMNSLEDNQIELEDFLNKFVYTRTRLTNYNIVLDLDETLIHSFNGRVHPDQMNIDEMNTLRTRLFEFKVTEPGELEEYNYTINGIKRPHLDDFLIFCSGYFQNVIIWSAGESRYVKKIVEYIFRDLNYPDLVLTRDHIFSYRGVTIKPLEYLISSSITEENTFVVDDKLETFILNKDNAIKIPPYDPNPSFVELKEEENSLKRLIEWFKSIGTVEDIRTIDKSRIFD